MSRRTSDAPASSSKDSTGPHEEARFSVPVRGTGVDVHTRCAHYRSPLDVIALRCACCEAFYPCHRCHEEETGHPLVPWPRDRFSEAAVLCGVCGETLTAHEYLAHPESCTRCGAAFNPGCRSHHGLYFEGA